MNTSETTQLKLVVDADSILYTACYGSQLVNRKDGPVYTEEAILESFNIEKAYMLFCYTVAGISAAVYKEKEQTVDTEIIFSPKKVFRHKLSSIYKANRKPSTIVGIADLKMLVQERIGATQVDDMEADDIVISRAYEEENVVIACIDKDIYTHSPVDCFNYKKWLWVEKLPQEIIERNYWHQALMGDPTDGIKGAKGVGDVKAAKLVDSPWFDWDTYRMQFESEELAVLSMQLVRLDQYKKGELELWTNTKTQ